MEPERWEVVKEVFNQVLEAPPDARDEVVAAAHLEEPLRKRLEALLRAFALASSYLSQGPAAFLSTLGAEREVGAGTSALAPGDRLGHYQLVSLVGAGGMGRVYLARHTALARLAALKVLGTDPGPNVLARLRREGEALSRLQHPAIATFYEVGDDAGTTFIAMEFVRGPTLRELLRGGPLAVDQALAVAGCLLEALTHAHAAGLVHRDIKPENVIVTGARTAKLLDFGLALPVPAGGDNAGARPWDDRLTRAGTMLGTAGYMSPEQVRGDDTDARSDLFSLALVLYECLTGRSAFAGATPAERQRAVLEDAPVPFHVAGVPHELWLVVARGLARAPSDRHASARAFLSELQHVMSDRVATGLPHTLAVVDFENLTHDPALSWMGSGIAESIAARLGRMGGVDVMPRTQVLRGLGARDVDRPDPVDAGLTLGCRWVVSGGYRCLDRALGVSARLTEVASGRAVYTEDFDATPDRLFEIQDRVADACATCLGRTALEVVPSGPNAARLAAFEAYTRGRELRNRKGRAAIAEAIELYEHAVASDPTYAPALAALASASALRFISTTDPADLDRAGEYARLALDRDPDNAEAHVWIGYVLWRQDRFDEALAAWRRAMDLDPHDCFPHYFATYPLFLRGDRAAAVAAAQRAVAIEPNQGIFWILLGWVHTTLNQLVDARYSYQRAMALTQPTAFFPGAAGFLADCERRTGNLGAARAAALAGLESVEGSDFMYRDMVRAFCLLTLGRTALAQGDRAAAAGAFSQAEAQLRGRPRVLGSGHLLVQAQSGQARALGDVTMYRAARTLFEERPTHDFHMIMACHDDETLAELAYAARALELGDEARRLEARARALGWIEPTGPGAA